MCKLTKCDLMGVISVFKNVSTFQQVESEAVISILWAWKINGSLTRLKRKKVGQIYLDGSLVCFPKTRRY